MSTRPPRAARALLWLILGAPDRDAALGDLEEEHGQIADLRGRATADRWYWAQVRAAVAPSVRRRASSSGRSFADVGHDVRLALRVLRHRPGLSTAAVATLALGIGAATAIFSVAEAVLLRPIPYPEGERLVQIWNTYDTWRGHEVLDAFWDHIQLSWPEFEELRAAQTSFDDVAIYGTSPQPLTGRGEAREVLVGAASPTLFDVLGASPVLGRGFTQDEVGAAAARVAVLSNESWRGLYGADRDVLGQSITLGGETYTVVGVLPEGFYLETMGFRGHRPHAAWVPVGAWGGLSRGNHWYEAIGRLTEGIEMSVAHEESARILRGEAAPGERGARLTLRKAEEVGDAARPLVLLLAGVGVLLLIACGNYATLLMGEATRRRAELATRAALGARKSTLLGQLALESALLGLAGGVVGLFGAWLALGAFLRATPASLGLPESLGLNAPVLAFGIGLGLVTGLTFGLAPGLSVRVGRLTDELRGARSGPTRAGRSAQRVVLAAQVALSLLLLVTGGLLARSLGLLSEVDPGFEADGLWSARVAMSGTLYEEVEARRTYREIVTRLAAVPGVEAATLASAMPFSGSGGSSSFDIVGREVADDEKQPEALRRTVLPGYHQALGIPLRAGRHLQDADREWEAPVIVISESMAARYWPNGDALGARIERDRREWEIVGVVADVLHAELGQPAQSTFYVPFEVAEVPFGMTVALRTDLPAERVAELVRGTVREVDGDIPVDEVVSADALIGRSIEDERFRSWLLLAFAGVATLLSALGLFGVTARIVAARRRELGIRLALGASRPEVVRRVALEESRALAAGIAVGVVAALLSGGLLAGFLFGVTERDPLAFVGAVAVLGVTGVLSSALAAHRGAGLDPAEAIRTE